jgi:hypothetical protein
MAEALPLTRAGKKPIKDTPVAGSSPPKVILKTPAKTLTTYKTKRDERAGNRYKRSRPTSDTPSPKCSKPPQPGFKSKLKPTQLNPSILTSVEKLAKQGQVTNSPFLNLVPATMERNDLELLPKGAKPYRDYLDRDYEFPLTPMGVLAPLSAQRGNPLSPPSTYPLPFSAE